MNATLNKMHVKKSTGLSLNDRFTAISSQPKINIFCNSRRTKQQQVLEHVTSSANQRILAQLQKKYKMKAALKLKRRSMRTFGGGLTNKHFNNRSKPLRRSNSSSNLGPRRSNVSDAAQRIAQRYQRNTAGLSTTTSSGGDHNRSLICNNNAYQFNNRSYSRNASSITQNNNVRRGRLHSGNRRPAIIMANKSNLSIKARLGVRPGTITNPPPNNTRHNASLPKCLIQSGRVQKRRNPANANSIGNGKRYGGGVTQTSSGVRKNSNVRAQRRFRTSKNQGGPQKQLGAGQAKQQRNNRAPRGGKNNSNNGVFRNQGYKTTAATKSPISKDDLDKELDQYMSLARIDH